MPESLRDAIPKIGQKPGQSINPDPLHSSAPAFKKNTRSPGWLNTAALPGCVGHMHSIYSPSSVGL